MYPGLKLHEKAGQESMDWELSGWKHLASQDRLIIPASLVLHARLLARSKHSNYSFSALTAVPGGKASQLKLTGLADFEFVVTHRVRIR